MTTEIKARIEQIKRGEVPQGYKKTEVGIVPREWEVKKLENIVTKLAEKAGNQKLETLSISAGKGFVNQAEKFGKELSGKQYVNYTVIYKGDFSYNKGNSKKYPQGCIYMLKAREKAAVPNVFNSFRFNEQIGEFYEQLFINGAMNKQLFKYINSGVRNDGLLNLYDDDFYNCRVVIPSQAEQQKIADILTTQDKVIELKQKLIAEKQQQKKYLMQNMLTGKKRLKGFSGEWINIKLGELFDERIERNATYLPLLAITGIKGVVPRSELDLKDNSSEDKSKYLKICIGDIGYNTMRMWQGVSAFSEYEGIVSPAYTILKPKFYINAKYFSYLFKMSDVIFMFYRFSQGLVDDTRNLKYSNFKQIKVYYPIDKKEQTTIAAILSNADREIELLQKQLAEEKQKKKALMQLLLTGIVRV
ncbi:MAG: restriction endonuclease subunit S [Anaerotignum propionicum]|uniref:restriction endonuclease subunit S n=1 Tax=Anaerotignum propionicum TaxID=28446 RepID=UPI002B1FE657|nr:restriction endonuclease subunit S [Anaerotignum propionicum]MEA5057222.1 restriction endonuclease subunit S [Anaerotignum propionicum]